MKITKAQLKRIVAEEARKLNKQATARTKTDFGSNSERQEMMQEEQGKNLNEDRRSDAGREIHNIKDELFDIYLQLHKIDGELAERLKLQTDRLVRLGYKA